jgi:hypothetical protein
MQLAGGSGAAERLEQVTSAGSHATVGHLKHFCSSTRAWDPCTRAMPSSMVNPLSVQNLAKASRLRVTGGRMPAGGCSGAGQELGQVGQLRGQERSRGEQKERRRIWTVSWSAEAAGGWGGVQRAW